jgi:hypothetical protein
VDSGLPLVVERPVQTAHVQVDGPQKISPGVASRVS